MQNYRNIKAWEKAHAVSLRIYEITRQFPPEERYGLTNQMRRSAMSVPSNIAEGCGRSGDPEFAQFLHIAKASASELDYQILLARDLGFMDEDSHTSLGEAVNEVQKMLGAFIRSLRASNKKKRRLEK